MIKYEWFAWYPVKIHGQKTYVWLRTVLRIRGINLKTAKGKWLYFEKVSGK